MSERLTHDYIQQRFNVRLAPDETALQSYTRYGIVFLGSLLLFLVLLVPAVFMAGWILTPNPYSQPPRWLLAIPAVWGLMLLAFIIYRYVDWRNDALILTDQRLIYIEQTLLFSQMQREAALSKVQNVRFVVRGLISTLLDFGSIQIETAARGTDISFGPIHRPRNAQRDIMVQVEGIRAKTSAELMRQTLLHRLDPDTYPEPQVPGLSDEAQGEPFAGRFHMPLLPPNPLISGDTITWHKHGYFLLLRILRALVILAALVIVAILLASYGAPAIFWGIWAVILIAALVYLVFQYQIWLGDVYIVTVDRLHDVYRTPFGLFGESRRSALLERIQNISYNKPGLLANLLNFGDVRIQTAGAEDLTFNRVPHPDQVQSEIYRRQERSRLRQQQQEREQIAEWLVTYRKIDQNQRNS